MTHFGAVLGQIVNYFKSKIFFSKNSAATKRNHTAGTLNILEGSSFGKYLGFPISNTKLLELITNFSLTTFGGV